MVPQPESFQNALQGDEEGEELWCIHGVEAW